MYHPVFINSLLPGYDFIDGDSDPSEVANTVDDDGDGITDAGYGHGTMVAGIIALVAPGAKILPIRALDDEGRSNAWLLSVATRYAVDRGADVINMSFGVPVEIDALENEISNAYDHNVMVVAAAGNESREEPAYHPAIDGKAIMVIAVDENDVKADFSDWNSDAAVAAPGTGVRSAHPDGWALGSGCSFAAPFITGEVALIRSRLPGINHHEVERILEAAVDPIDQLPGNELYAEQLGSGRVYLPRALAATVAAPDAPAIDDFRLSPNPARSVVLFQGESIDRSQITVFDVAGRAVARLARGQRSWDVTMSSGARVAPGTYYVRVIGATAVTRSVKILP
jgi:subtilisin family serine protease